MDEEREFDFVDDGISQEIIDPPDIEIEVVDDTPEVDRNRKPLKDPVDDPTDDELAHYDEKVQKRIKTAHRKMHDERREKEAAQREKEQAILYAQRMQQRAKELENQLHDGSKVYIAKAQSEADYALKAAKEEYKQAYDDGDVDAIAAAQEKIARAVALHDNAKQLQPLTAPQEPLYTPPQQSPEVQLDDKQKTWFENNSWFQGRTDQELMMRGAALGLHEALINKGIDPKSDDYYNRIDDYMQTKFPEFFQTQRTDDNRPVQRHRTATTVAPARRSSAPRKVTLTPSQLNVAKRLGVEPKEYARQMLKMSKGAE